MSGQHLEQPAAAAASKRVRGHSAMVSFWLGLALSLRVVGAFGMVSWA